MLRSLRFLILLLIVPSFLQASRPSTPWPGEPPTKRPAPPTLFPTSVGPVLIKGYEVAPEVFPEAIYIENNRGARCTSTLIGKRAILTAAHCLEDSRVINPVDRSRIDFKAVCEGHEEYTDFGHDIAICHLDRDIGKKPASLWLPRLMMGQSILLSGYGCVRSDRSGGNDGIFRIGLSHVEQLPRGDDTFIMTRHEAAICSGDSGGAAYLPMDDISQEHHWVIGVNSRGDMSDLSMLTAVNHPDIITWLRKWSRDNSAPICGLNRRCERSIRFSREAPEIIERPRSRREHPKFTSHG